MRRHLLDVGSTEMSRSDTTSARRRTGSPAAVAPPSMTKVIRRPPIWTDSVATQGAVIVRQAEQNGHHDAARATTTRVRGRSWTGDPAAPGYHRRIDE